MGNAIQIIWVTLITLLFSLTVLASTELDMPKWEKLLDNDPKKSTYQENFVESLLNPRFLTQGISPQADTAEEKLRNLHFFYDNKGMILSPSFLPISLTEGLGGHLVKLISGKIKDEFGMTIDKGKIVGYFEAISKEGNRVGVVGCAVCHSGRAAGQTIIGLGNKNIDIFRLAKTAAYFEDGFEKADRWNPFIPRKKRAERRELAKASAYFIDQITNEKLAAKTQGLIPIGYVRRWFYDQQGVEMDTTEPGQVKIPAFWGYGEKRKLGSFSDGFGNGVDPGWAVAVELVAGQTVENVRKMEHKLHKAEDVLADLLPPAYPFQINQDLAIEGKKIFNNTCYKCHGTYERDHRGHPVYKLPKHKPWKAVKTDSTRLEGVTDYFKELVRLNPLSELLNATDLEPGYIAPRLHGIWARFPYLHNASVPTVYDLMLPPARRPKAFSLRNAGELERFDKVKLGLNKDTKLSPQKLNQKIQNKDRSLYDTQRHGHSNQGHYFNFMRNFTEKDRMAVVEYLKTL